MLILSCNNGALKFFVFPVGNGIFKGVFITEWGWSKDRLELWWNYIETIVVTQIWSNQGQDLESRIINKRKEGIGEKDM